NLSDAARFRDRQDFSPPSFFSAFFGRGGPSTGGNDLRYCAMAARSSGLSCEVFLITRAMAPPALSPSGSCPVSRKYSMSFVLHSSSPFCVMFGTQIGRAHV